MKNKNKPLLMEVNRIFLTVGYDYHLGFNEGKFFASAIKTLNQTATLKDANVVLSCLLQFQRLYKDFIDAIQDPEALKFFLDLKTIPLKLNLKDEVDNQVYFVSNALTPDHRKFYVTNSLFNGNHILYTSSFKKVKTYSYVLNINRKICEIYSNDNQLIIKAKLQGKFLSLVCNNSNYCLIKGSKCVNLILKDHLKDYKSNKSNNKYLVASYGYMKVKHPNQLGVVNYKLYDENADKELIDLLAISYLVLLRKD